MNKLLRYFLTFFITFNFIVSTHGQTGSSTKSIEFNNIKARIKANGTLFQDVANGAAAFEVPSGSGSHAIFHSSFCFSAKDSNDKKYAVGNYYDNSDLSSGPLTVDSGTTTATISIKFDEIWEVSKRAISSHKTNYNLATYTTPTHIEDWPAHGDTTKGYDYHLAPFFDQNNNGTYEPDSGDYPIIKGDIAYYFILNDDNVHVQTGGNPMGIELHVMVYAYAMNNALNDAIFVDYTIINRSKKDYKDCYIGNFTDFDLGNPLDDFIETDVNRSLVFAKNGDNYDDDIFGMTGYRDSLASIGIITLKGPLLDADSLDNDCDTATDIYAVNGLGFSDGIIDNERLGMSNSIPIDESVTYSGEYDSDSLLFNYMRSIWSDGRPLTFDDNGHRISGGTEVRMPYYSNTDTARYSSFGDSVTTNWTENGTLNVPGDRKVVSSSGPFTLKSGERQEVSYAYVFARADLLSNVANSVSNLKKQVDTIINDFRLREQITQCIGTVITTSIGNQIDESEDIRLYPNPTAGVITIMVELNATIEILNTLGNQVFQKRLRRGENTIQIPDDLANGIYFTRIVDRNKKVKNAKFILSR